MFISEFGFVMFVVWAMVEVVCTFVWIFLWKVVIVVKGYWWVWIFGCGCGFPVHSFGFFVRLLVV